MKKYCIYPHKDLRELTKEHWKLAKISSHTTDMIVSCIESSGNRSRLCSENLVPVPAVFKGHSVEVRPSLCYVINSVLGNADYEAHFVEKDFNLKLVIGTEPHEYEMPIYTPSIQVMIHDPKKKVNPYYDGHKLKGGHKYQAHITNIAERISMPPPYDTNCMDYIKMWKNNGGSGPLSEQACIEHCILENKIKKNETCIPIYIAYSHEEVICQEIKGLQIDFDLENKCSEQCGFPCFDRSYTVDFEEVGSLHCNSSVSPKNVSEWCRVANISLDISFQNNHIHLTQTINKERIQDFVLFGNIGGYLGLWIGLSLLDIIDFMKRLLLICMYPFSKERIKNFKLSLKSNSKKCSKRQAKRGLASIFRNSYINSVADVASAGSKKEKLQKMLVFILCICGLMWHSSTLMTVFLSYKTVRKEITTKPLTFAPPAITICDNTIRTREEICRKRSEDCFEIDNQNLLCKEYPTYCPFYFKKYFGIVKTNPFCSDDCLSWDEVKETVKNFYKPAVSDENQGDIVTGGFQAIAFTSNQGEPTLCFTYRSQVMKGVGKAKSNDSEKKEHFEARNISTWLGWRVVHFLRAYDHADRMENASLYMAIHDAKRRVNPFREGFKLKFLQRYFITIIEEIEMNLLPPPYDTNCSDYLKNWYKSNRSGPLTTVECVETCQFHELLQIKHCIPRMIGISHMEQLCNETEIVPQDVLNYCVDQCGPPCLERTYKFEIVEIPYQILRFNHGTRLTNVGYAYQIDSTNRLGIHIEMSFRKFHLTQIEYDASLRVIDLFSNMGGYLGIWIGLSIVSLLNLVYLVSIAILTKWGKNKSMPRKIKRNHFKTNIQRF